jgi:ankyrin repeat protein
MPLHYAVAGSYDAIVKLLLQAGASVSVSNIEGATSYDVALKERQCGTVEALVRYGRMPTCQVSQNMGWNGIHRKARGGTITPDEAARADRDALIARDTFGRIPMYRALEMGHWEPAKTLMLALLDKEINLPVSDLVDLATVVCEHLNPASINASTILHELLNGIQPFSLPATSEDVHARAQQLLITVMEQNDLDSIAALLRAGVCLDTRRSFNPVETAICSGSVGAAIHLIEYGTGVHFPDPSCSTSPLHTACGECMPEVAKLLLEKGADPNRFVQSNHDNSVSTPLQFLIFGVGEQSPEGSLRCAELLLDHGATVVGVENLKGDSPAWEIMSGLFESQDSAPWRGLPAWWQSTADLIASRGFAMLTRPLNESGPAPIHLAVESGDVEALEQELDAGVPVDWKSFKYPRKRPLQIAVEKDNADMVAVLLQYGAAVDGEFDLGGGRKHATRGVATEVKSEEVRRLLLEVQRRELAGW